MIWPNVFTVLALCWVALPCNDLPSFVFENLLLLQVAEIEEAEKDKMRKKCKKIIDHGVNVFVNRQLIYNFPEQARAETARARAMLSRHTLLPPTVCGLVRALDGRAIHQ